MERAQRTRHQNSLSRKRSLPKDRIEAGESSVGKKVRFSTRELNAREGFCAHMNNTAEQDGDDIMPKSSIHVAKKPTPFWEERERSVVYKNSVDEPRHAEKIMEADSAKQTKRNSRSDKSTSDKSRKIVASSWNPFQRQSDSDPAGIKDRSGMDEVLNSNLKPEVMGQRFSELHTLIKIFISQWYTFNELAVHPSGRSSLDANPLKILTPGASTELKHYITCYVSGGPAGREGWEQLFKDKDSREAVMYSVIGKALEEHVFGELLFGADEKQLKQLQQQEVSDAEIDGKADGVQGVLFVLMVK